MIQAPLAQIELEMNRSVMKAGQIAQATATWQRDLRRSGLLKTFENAFIITRLIDATVARSDEPQ